ncbi:siderophore-interacting protein [Chryseobacterium sp. c4a]|uniref:siderophore-interacting protein n=1 Tax=Chryseobacterium sp. c4a TaxID=1573582 RepID=UPI00135756EC|nr:siderophore-interacting protein [Chryseobacterium sp. c4a]
MKSELTNINSGEIISSKKLTSTAWHIKLKVPFYIELDMDRNPGYIFPLLTGDEEQENTLLIRSTLWNYDVVRNTVEIIIYERKGNEEWLENLSSGQMIRYLDPEEIIIQGLNADNFYLIGNTDAQAFFYQFNRSLPFTNTVNSFIYSKNTGEFFPDIDGSYPLNYHIIYPFSPERVLHLFKKSLIRENESFIILLFCEHEVNMLFSQYFKKEWGAAEHQIRIANYNH